MKHYSKTLSLNGKEITFTNKRVTAPAYIDFLKRTDLGSQYPKEDFAERISTLVQTVPISLIAYHNKIIIGVCFGLTDFAYWLFLSDLGVDRNYSKMGIGRALVEQALELAGGSDNIFMFTTPNDKARGFYTKLGWKPADFIEYNKTKWTDFIVE